ncbi:hypothetical protein EDD86DRAFT_208631 [Gorgonomyces haynaldii]|nr:hypothetical protein EDD86DRAFT_208631 [Gorgonomyces haynaldii]
MHLPPEVLLTIFDILDSDSLLKVSRTCSRCYRLVLHYRFDMDCGRQIEYKPKGDNLHMSSFSAITQMSESGTIDYIGIRRKGDRCFVSRLPLRLNAHEDCLYFEVTVLKQQVHDLPMRIGLVPRTWNREFAPGSCTRSLGYSSHDGYISLSIRQKFEEIYQFAPPWKQGDVVGCGFSHKIDRGTVFFTLNGHWVGDAPFKIDTVPIDYRGDWHAAFSSSGPCLIQVNLGASKFRYDVSKGSPHLLLRALESLSICDPVFLPNTLDQSADPYNKPTIVKDLIEFPPHRTAVTRSCIANISMMHLESKYFEVEILDHLDPFGTFLSVGVCLRPYSPFHHIGWNYNSIALHSDDGRIYHNAHQLGQQFSEPFGAGTILGCGYDPTTKELYFTINGELVGRPMQGDYSHFYPAIGCNGQWNVRYKLNACGPVVK